MAVSLELLLFRLLRFLHHGGNGVASAGMDTCLSTIAWKTLADGHDKTDGV